MSASYGYTLQPIPYELSAAEQKEAQYDLWQKSNQIKPKLWAILGAISLVAIAGLIFLRGYSTAIFWLLLIGVALFLAVRIFGLSWYAKREMAKMPVQDIKGIKMGVQPSGLIMLQKIGQQEGRGMIEWKDVSEWQETEKYIYLTCNSRGQTGTQILPKRLAEKKFPLDTVRKHLTEVVGPAK